MARNRIIPIFVAHLGCPHQCVFCDQRRIAGVSRPVTPEEASDQLRQGLTCSGPGAEAAFYGGSFTATAPAYQQALLDAAAPFLESRQISAIRVSTRPDAISESCLERLWRGGVRTVELGCQSMDDGVLLRSGRGHDRESVLQAVSLLRQGGFHVILQMMTGLPGASDKSDLETARALAELQPDGVRIYPTVVVRGTELETWYRQGRYQPQTVEEAVSLCARLLEIFLERRIPVLRIGLQPTDALSGGDAVDGPYHPALGEMVKSRLYRNRAEGILSSVAGAPEAVLGVAANRISWMTGQKRRNLQWLEKQFSIGKIRVQAADAEDWEIILQSPGNIGKISR